MSFVSCNSGLEVTFVYDSSTMMPMHAIVKRERCPGWGAPLQGALCGWYYMHQSFCSNPDTICYQCRELIEKQGDKWVVKNSLPDKHYRFHEHTKPCCSYD